MEEIQRIQDEFAQATGVASIITRLDGTPITKPSNFTDLCSKIIRKTEKGCANCYRSDAAIGRYHPAGPIVQPCLSGGLWDAGASITVGGRHIANWLIGQVRDETQTEQNMRAYAREIGADEESLLDAFRRVPSMTHKHFKDIAQALFTLANQLSASAYQNILQARFINELQQAEATKAKLEDQLRQAQKMESVGRLAGGVAHDFNNMLGVILGHTDMAMDQVAKTQPLYADLLEIRKAAQRSADLTRQLLAFGRKQTIAPRILDLNESVVGMMNMLRRLVGENIDLVWKPGDNLWSVKADPSQVDQILTNLCINARDAISGTGRLTIETGNKILDEAYCAENLGAVAGEYVLLAVSDTGCGMDQDILAHIFEPFFTTKELGKGTGLGLSTVYGIVKQHNGFINVSSEPGHGSIFKIYLPRQTEHVTRAEVKEVAFRESRGTETILLVEDEPTMMRMTTVMLEKQGYTVLVASSPSEALRLASELGDKISLLITDMVMPGMNGRDLAGILQQANPRLKCLFMSAYTANVIAANGMLGDGVHFIQKPFSREDLSCKVREALEG